MKRDHNKPKRSLAFHMFMDEFRKQYTEKCLAIRPVSIVKAGGDKWKSLSAAEKAPYVAKLEERMAEYHMNMQTYERKAAKEAFAIFASLKNKTADAAAAEEDESEDSSSVASDDLFLKESKVVIELLHSACSRCDLIHFKQLCAF